VSSNKARYYEVQEMKGTWVWIVLLGLTVLSFSLMIAMNISEKNTFDIKVLIYVGSGLSLVFTTIAILFSRARLETTIDARGISFRFPPFQLKSKNIPFSQIIKWEVGDYNPMKEAGGWGSFKAGKPKEQNPAYIVSGKTALFLHLDNGKRIILGTQRKDAIQYAMRKQLEN
jgi:hypothetical protein